MPISRTLHRRFTLNEDNVGQAECKAASETGWVKRMNSNGIKNGSTKNETVTHQTKLFDQTSIYCGRFNEQRALERLRAKDSLTRVSKLSKKDLIQLNDEQRWERVFNPETVVSESKLKTFKQELQKVRRQRRSAVLIKATKKAFGPAFVPVLFGAAVMTIIVTLVAQMESQVYAAQGMALMAKGDNEKAYTFLRKSLIFNPYNVTSSFQSGRIDERRKERQAAYEHFDRALKVDPNNVKLLDHKGALAVKLNRFSDGATAYTRLIKMKNIRKQPHYFGNRAVAFSGLGQFERAIDDYTALLKMRRRDKDALIGRSFCNLQISQHEAALADLDRVLAINPNEYEALVLKGWAYQTLNNYAESKANLEKAIAVEPKNVRARIYLAHMYRQQGNGKTAVQELNKVIAIQPNSRDAHVLKGQIQLALGQHQSAVNEFKIADQLKQEENYYTLLERARASYGAGDKQEALKSYNKLIALKPDESKIYFERGEVNGALGKFENGIKDMDKAITLYPNFTQAMLKKAEFNHQIGNNVSAIANYNQAIKASPSDSIPLVAFGKFNLEIKNYVTARECFEKATRINKNDKSVKQLIATADQSLLKLVGAKIVIDSGALSPRETAEIEKSDFNTLMQNGYKAAKAHKLKYAVAALEQAVRLQPNSVAARRYLASILLVAAKPSQAEGQMVALTQLGADEPGDSLLLATAYRKTGDCEKAIVHLEQHLAKNPTDVNSLADLSDFYASTGNTGKAIDICHEAMSKTTNQGNYARLKERLLSLQESESRSLEKRKATQSKISVDTQG
ncbi:MAG: tetratricopeptide repeat protein [Candidatus Obscuribacterales bacterium]|nr:tetratricopeptide repeat protein [Candidatus Obscuribacterales bacterium]